MFWKKKIDSEEYLKLRKLIDVLTLDVELLNQRYKKKIKPREELTESNPNTINDGFDELRKLNKDKDYKYM